MRLIKLCCTASVALLLTLCKAVYADETTGFIDAFKVGGYTSAGITIPRKGDAEAAINEISLIVTWENDSRFKFFSELELEQPLSWND